MGESHLSFLGAASLVFSTPLAATSGKDRYSDRESLAICKTCLAFVAAPQALQVRKKLAQSDDENKRLWMID